MSHITSGPFRSKLYCPCSATLSSVSRLSRGYPLRPEFVESTWYLYRATRDPFYLDVGAEILESLSRSVVPCGLASFANLDTGELVDRQESFVLSETAKYLFLLFDEDSWINADDSNMVFTTEGHLLRLNSTHLHPLVFASFLRRRDTRLRVSTG